MDSKEFKEQAEYIWNRLDDLAKSDPNAYKKFIEKQMEEHKITTSAPEPAVCLQTKSVSGEPMDVFINICAWRRMPYPESEEEPIKLFAGEKKMKKSKGVGEVIVPVGINDKIYNECTDTELNRKTLYGMIVDLVENSIKIKLSRSYKTYKEIYKGDLPADPRTLFLSRSQISSESNIEKQADNISSPNELLKRMAQMHREDENGGQMRSKVETEVELDKLLGKKVEEKEKKNLIQEIGVDMTEKDNDDAQLPCPEHTLDEFPADDKKPARCVVKIQLPNVSSVAECDLNITENSLELTVEDKYYFSTTFTRAISEDDSSAKFNRKNQCLTVSLPFK